MDAQTRFALQEVISFFDTNNFTSTSNGCDLDGNECKDNVFMNKRIKTFEWVFNAYKLLAEDDSPNTCTINYLIKNNILKIFCKLLKDISYDNTATLTNTNSNAQNGTCVTLGEWIADACKSVHTYNMCLRNQIIRCLGIILIKTKNKNNSILIISIDSGIIDILTSILDLPLFDNMSINVVYFDTIYHVLHIIGEISRISYVTRDKLLKHDLIKIHFFKIYEKCINFLKKRVCYGVLNFNISLKELFEICDENKIYEEPQYSWVNEILETTMQQVFNLINIVDLKHSSPLSLYPSPPTQYIIDAIEFAHLFIEMDNNNDNNNGNNNDNIVFGVCKIIENISLQVPILEAVFLKLIECNMIEFLIKIVKNNNEYNYDSRYAAACALYCIGFSRIGNIGGMKCLIESDLLDCICQLLINKNENSTDGNLRLMEMLLRIVACICGGPRDHVKKVMNTPYLFDTIIHFLKRGICLDDDTDIICHDSFIEVNCKIIKINNNNNNNSIRVESTKILKKQLNLLATGFFRDILNSIWNKNISPNDISSIIMKYCDNDIFNRYSDLRATAACAISYSMQHGISISEYCFGTWYPWNLVLPLYNLLNSTKIDKTDANAVQTFCKTIDIVIQAFENLSTLGYLYFEKVYDMLNEQDKCKMLVDVANDGTLPLNARMRARNLVLQINNAFGLGLTLSEQ